MRLRTVKSLLLSLLRPYRVEYGTKGATSVYRRKFATERAARRFASETRAHPSWWAKIHRVGSADKLRG